MTTANQVVLVTGATSGLGRQVAQDLAGAGAAVLLHGRDRARCEAAADAIRDATGSERPVCHVADLSSLADVRRMAADVRDRHDRLDVLINNAGVGGGPRGRG